MNAVPNLGLQMHPIKLALRIPLGMIWIANVLDLRPGDEDVIKIDHGIKFVADGGQWTVVRVRIGFRV